MTLQPGLHFGMLVRGVIVANEMNFQTGSNLAVELAQEGQPFLMTMTRCGLREDSAGKIIKGRKQGHRPVPVIVMGLRRPLC